MISAAVILATPALASAAAAVVPVAVDGTVAVTMSVNVSLYLQHKLKCSLVMIMIQAVPMVIIAMKGPIIVSLSEGELTKPRWWRKFTVSTG